MNPRRSTRSGAPDEYSRDYPSAHRRYHMWPFEGIVPVRGDVAFRFTASKAGREALCLPAWDEGLSFLQIAERAKKLSIL